MNPRNLEIFERIFNWHPIDEVSDETVKELSRMMGIPLDEGFSMKSKWGYFKKYTISDPQDQPILFLKYVRAHYPEEILGLHLTRYFLDPELGFQEYYTGVLHKRRKEVPFIITTFEQGDHVGNKDINEYKFQLGRLGYIHEILSLYDVEDRHFIVREDDSVCRIDFGRSFEHPERKYVGFKEYLAHKKFGMNDPEFQAGYQEEKRTVKQNLQGKRTKLLDLMRNFKELRRDDEIVFKLMDRISNRVIDHWNKINFLEECNLTECQWI